MKKRVIIDCDPGIDDSLALMYALASPELEVAGITVVCGNVPVEYGVENARKVCRLMGREDIPVYAGAEAPLSRPLVTAQDTHGEDGLGNRIFRWFQRLNGPMITCRQRGRIRICRKAFSFC